MIWYDICIIIVIALQGALHSAHCTLYCSICSAIYLHKNKRLMMFKWIPLIINISTNFICWKLWFVYDEFSDNFIYHWTLIRRTVRFRFTKSSRQVFSVLKIKFALHFCYLRDSIVVPVQSWSLIIIIMGFMVGNRKR